MDVFIRQLQELTKASSNSDNASQAVSDHCKHVAVKLLRKFKNGTRGTLELRYLLEDLLSSLPAEQSSNTRTDPYRDIRAFAKLFTSQNGLQVPLKSKPKRPASVDAANLIDGPKRSKVDGIDDSASVLQGELANAQLLYDLFNDIDGYSASSSKSSISQLLSQALALEQTSGTANDRTSTGIAVKGSRNTLDLQGLRSDVNTFLPPAPRGQTLRDKVSTLFSQAESSRDANDSASRTNTLDFLESLTEVLARLCAPIRDDQVKSIQASISTCREYISLSSETAKLDDAFKSVQEKVQALVRDMNNDLRLFKLGITVATTDESELRDAIKKESMEREKKIITKIYGDPMGLTGNWLEYSQKNAEAVTLDINLTRSTLTTSLLEKLFKAQPITVDVEAAKSISAGHQNGIISEHTSFVPPIFHLAAKHLFIIQNRLQAFTILATLSTLVPSSRSAPSSQVNGSIASSSDIQLTAYSWSERVWTLLTSALEDEDGHTTSPENTNTKSQIKLTNLADEIIKIIKSPHGSEVAPAVVNEEKIRSSVDRMLRLEDRVFALLHGRLKNALKETIVQAEHGGMGMEIKGFGVSPLPQEMAITCRQLRGIIDWACQCWSIER